MKALITGASRGIGKAIACALANDGWDLILLASGKEDLYQLASMLEQKHPKLTIKKLVCDLSIPNQRQALLKEMNAINSLDLLVNNVGIYKENKASETIYKDLQEMLQINLFAAIELSRELIPVLVNSERACIVNIGSVMSLKAAAYASNYSISKHALKAWTDALREELREGKIRVCGIYPGAVNTSSWDKIAAEKSKMIQPEDIAKLVAILPDLGESTLVEEVVVSPLSF